MKDIYAGKQLPPETLATPKAIDRVVRTMRESEPLAAWLRQQVRSGM